jgi:transcriptional regulator with XRE-family HTH domain
MMMNAHARRKRGAPVGSREVAPAGRYASTGTMIREARHRRGVAQEALAARCGVMTASVARWEAGERVPEAGHLRALATFLEPADPDAFVADIERVAFEARLAALLEEDARHERWASRVLLDRRDGWPLPPSRAR